MALMRRRYKFLSKKVTVGKLVAADQRQLYPKMFIPDIIAKVETSGRKLAQVHWVMIKLVHPLLSRI
jgi:hypothetical protein